MKILFTICGRKGSKGIANKNIMNFLDKPLALYTLSAIDLFLNKYKNLEADIVISSDSIDLLNIFINNKIRPVSIINRDGNLALDSTPKIIVIQNCLEIMEGRNSKNYDMIIDMDITSPLRRVEDIQNLVEQKKRGNWDVVFSVTNSRRNPFFNMVKKENGNYYRILDSNFTARQEAPEVFDMNASLYAYAPEFLHAGKSLFDGKCGIIKMEDTGVLDLDNSMDFELMEVIATYLYEKRDDFRIVKDNIII
jgi:CMP-N-acetylneuraminic acid synthetase